MAYRIAVACSVGAASATIGALAYVRDVYACQPPPGSNLDSVGSLQTVWQQSCFKLSVPINQLPQQGATRLTDLYCRAFFRCWPMQCQRRLASLFRDRSTPDEAIQMMDFGDQDAVDDFRVIARGQSDVLFDAYSSFAFTWLGMSISDDNGSIHFHYGVAWKGAGYRGIPLQDYLAYQACMPIHALYSRVLLKATVQLLMRDLDRRQLKA